MTKHWLVYFVEGEIQRLDAQLHDQAMELLRIDQRNTLLGWLDDAACNLEHIQEAVKNARAHQKPGFAACALELETMIEEKLHKLKIMKGEVSILRLHIAFAEAKEKQFKTMLPDIEAFTKQVDM